MQMTIKIPWEFEVEIEQYDDQEEGRRYWAHCKSLSGCSVHASTELKAMERIREAIGVWLHFAERSIGDDFNVEDYI